MRISSVAEWLKSHDLERFAQIFEQNEVDLTTLRVLTESDFKELGIPFGPRKRILSLLSEERAVEKLSDLGGYVACHPSNSATSRSGLPCDRWRNAHQGRRDVLLRVRLCTSEH